MLTQFILMMMYSVSELLVRRMMMRVPRVWLVSVWWGGLQSLVRRVARLHWVTQCRSSADHC